MQSSPSSRAPLRGISSMAARQLLAELLPVYEQRSGRKVTLEAVGGVDAAKRVQSGEAFDFTVLGSDAIDKLVEAGRVVAGSRTDLVRSGVGVAIKAGTPRPDISSEDAVRRAVVAAPTLGYSTGPSGLALQKIFERWGVADQIKDRMVQARPGIPVGTLVAQGEVALGFQQMSELIHVQGIDIVGPLPPDMQIITLFSAGLVAGSGDAEGARELLAFLASPETADAKRRQGMEPA